MCKTVKIVLLKTDQDLKRVEYLTVKLPGSKKYKEPLLKTKNDIISDVTECLGKKQSSNYRALWFSEVH